MDKLYIPGDLVMVKKSALQFAKDKIFKVISSLSGGFVKVVMLNDSSTTYSISNNEVRPIPLTSEILEKNGWVKEEKDGSVFSLSEAFMGGDEDDEDNYTCFQLYYQNKKDGWVIDMRGEPLKFEIHYIHELQHLFFVLVLITKWRCRYGSSKNN